MYHCHEIPFLAFPSFAALKTAIEQYPFKGGLCRHLDENHLNWRPTQHPVEMHLTPDTCCLADAEFKTFQFTARASVEIGTCANGATVYITLWR